MTDRGEYISVEVAEVPRDLHTLLDAVERGGRIVHILRDGQAVAELRPPVSIPFDPLARHPEIADVVIAPDAFAPAAALPTCTEPTSVIFNADPAAPLDECDWPQDAR